MITIALYFAVFLSVLLPHMDVYAADSTISNLPSATTPLAGTEVLPIVQSGVTKKVAVFDIGGFSYSLTNADISAGGKITGTVDGNNITNPSPTTFNAIAFSSHITGSGCTPSTYEDLTVGWGSNLSALRLQQNPSYGASLFAMESNFCVLNKPATEIYWRAIDTSNVTHALIEANSAHDGTRDGVGLLVNETSGTDHLITLGTTTTQTGLSIRARLIQPANGDSMIWGKRATDTSPTGTLIWLRNAADTADVFKIGVDGHIEASYVQTPLFIANDPSQSSLDFRISGTSKWLQYTTGTNFYIRDTANSVTKLQVNPGTAGNGGIVVDGYMAQNAVVFASLPGVGNGAQMYCSDCTFANPCAGGGTGAFAKRLNGAWRCD